MMTTLARVLSWVLLPIWTNPGERYWRVGAPARTALRPRGPFNLGASVSYARYADQKTTDDHPGWLPIPSYRCAIMFRLRRDRSKHLPGAVCGGLGGSSARRDRSENPQGIAGRRSHYKCGVGA